MILNVHKSVQGGLIEVATSAEMNALKVDGNLDKIYRYTGTTTSPYVNGRLYLVVPAMPTKGQLITMNLGNGSQQYRVLKMVGNVAEVLAMYEASNSCAFGGSNTYANSPLDIALNNTFYNTLSDEAKSAIVQKNVIQYKYTKDNSLYNADTYASYADYSTKVEKAVVGNRYVYALGVEDIEEYFNGTFSTEDIWTMFWNTTSAPSTPTYPWLSSSNAGSSSNAWNVHGSAGRLFETYGNNAYAARPAFQIDLSGINFSISNS